MNDYATGARIWPLATGGPVGYVIASYGIGLGLAGAAAESIRRSARTTQLRIEQDRDGTGYSATLNRGLAYLPKTTEIVCCLNSDVEMLEADRAVVKLFEDDPLLAIVGPRQVDRSAAIVHGGIVPYPDGGTKWDLNLHHRHWKAPYKRSDVSAGTAGTFEVPMVSGSVFYVRRHVLDVLGGWPEWTRFYYEDTWLCYLARLYGWRVVYTGATTWRHFHEEGAPLDRADRVERLTVARERFCFEAGRAGIPLRFNEEVEWLAGKPVDEPVGSHFSVSQEEYARWIAEKSLRPSRNEPRG